MTHEMHTDFNYIYRDGQQFFPVIQDGGIHSSGQDASSAVVIRLSAKLDDDLIWDAPREEALEAIQNGKLVLWEIDFGLSNILLETSHSMEFYNYGIAIEEFNHHIWSEFKEHSLGVILYRGDTNFYERFNWKEDHLAYFLETIHDESKLSSIRSLIDSSSAPWHEVIALEPQFQFYAATMFAQYLQRLSSYLPEAALVFGLFDVCFHQSTAHLAQLLSKERFGHILLALKNSQVALGHLNWQEGACLGGWIGRGSAYFSTISQVRIGVCLPSDDMFCSKVESGLNSLFNELSLSQIPCRVIPESMLTEAWDGIDYIVIVSSTLSFQGKRRLQGFCAAGGTVVYMGQSCDLPSEMPYSDFRLELSSQAALI